jgi:hypothetical protein
MTRFSSSDTAALNQKTASVTNCRPKNLTVRIDDDAAVEGNETVGRGKNISTVTNTPRNCDGMGGGIGEKGLKGGSPLGDGESER